MSSKINSFLFINSLEILAEPSIGLHLDSMVEELYPDLTKEEWVRQNIIQFLIYYYFYPVSLIRVEFNLKFNTLSKRADIVCFDNNGNVMLLVECKSPEIQLNQNVFEFITLRSLSTLSNLYHS